MCVHCMCNQVCGTVHGFLSDGTDQVTIHVSGDRDARVTKQLAHYCDVSTRGQHQRRGTVSEAVEAQREEKSLRPTVRGLTPTPLRVASKSATKASCSPGDMFGPHSGIRQCSSEPPASPRLNLVLGS
jgi:hypothetical protein